MPDLIDRAALLKQLRCERDEYFNEHFVTDPSTGVAEASRAKEDYLDYLDERIEMIEQFPAVSDDGARWIARVKELEARLNDIRRVAR